MADCTEKFKNLQCLQSLLLALIPQIAHQLSLPFHEQRCLAQRPQHVQDLLVKHEHKS